MPTIREVRLAAVESLIDLTKTDIPVPTYDQLWKDSETILLPGLEHFGIPIIARFGRLKEPPVPRNSHRRYEAGFTNPG